MWGSAFSRADGSYPVVKNILKKGIKIFFLNFIFFIPKRKIELEFIEPDDFPKNGSRFEINAYLEKIYNEDASPNIYVPYYFYEKMNVV